MGRGRGGHRSPQRAANNSDGLVTYFLMNRSRLSCSPRGYLHLEPGCAPARGELPLCSSPPSPGPSREAAHGEVHARQPRSASPGPLNPSIAPLGPFPGRRAPAPGAGFPLATGGGRAGTGAPGRDQGKAPPAPEQDEPGGAAQHLPCAGCPSSAPQPFYCCTRGDPPAAPGCASAGLSRAGGSTARSALLPPRGGRGAGGCTGGSGCGSPTHTKCSPGRGAAGGDPGGANAVCDSYRAGDAVVRLRATSQSRPIELCRGQEAQRGLPASFPPARSELARRMRPHSVAFVPSMNACL